MDKAHKFVDKKIVEYEKELKKIYSKTLKELEVEMKKQSNKLNGGDSKTTRESLRRLDSLFKRMTVELNNADLKAVNLLEEELREIGNTNLEFAQDLINDKIRELGIDETYTLFNDEILKNIIEGNVFTELAIDGFTDKSYIYRELKREFATGLLKGESIPKLAKRIKKITKSSMDRAILIARTENTRVQNESREEVFKKAEKQGITMKKQWISAGDRRVRASHQRLNGEIVNMNESFSNNCQYPGDPNGGASEVCNCRCTFVALIEGVDY